MTDKAQSQEIPSIDDFLASEDDTTLGMDSAQLEEALRDTHRELDELVEGRTAAELLALNVAVQREIEVRKRLIEELATLHERTEQLKGSETERQRVQEAWEASEDRYRHMVEHSLGLICAHDMDGVFLSINPAAARALGTIPEEGIGKSLEEFLAPEVRHLFPDYLKRIRQNGSDEGIMRLVDKDGREMLWLYGSTVFAEPGKEPYVLGHAQDITELKRTENALRESEEKYRLLVEHASDAIFQIGLNGKVEFANRKAKGIFGYDPAEMVGRHFTEFASPECKRRALKSSVALLRRSDEESVETRLELEFLKKDGSTRCGDVNVNLIHHEGAVIGALAVVRDTRGQPPGTRHKREGPG
jgi:PAS domain S-box-containing protein